VPLPPLSSLGGIMGVAAPLVRIIVKKLNSLKHLVRTTVAESHN